MVWAMERKCCSGGISVNERECERCSWSVGNNVVRTEPTIAYGSIYDINRPSRPEAALLMYCLDKSDERRFFNCVLPVHAKWIRIDEPFLPHHPVVPGVPL